MTGKNPIESRVVGDFQLGHDLALAMGAPCLRDGGDALEHQHRRQWQLGIARAEQVAPAAGQQVLVLVARWAFRHFSLFPLVSGAPMLVRPMWASYHTSQGTKRS